MLKSTIQEFKYGRHRVTLETGAIARQATATVVASLDDTTVLVSVVGNEEMCAERRFLPLTVYYQERTYAAGRFPGGFFRREGRPGECETLISRLIDRPIRPLFPEGFPHEVQIIATVVSVNPQVNPDIVAMIGASAALGLSGLPFGGPIGAARVGYIADRYVLNPTTDELALSRLDLVIAGTSDAVLMVEAEAKMLSEDQMLGAILYGHEQQQVVIENIRQLVERAGRPRWDWSPKVHDPALREWVVHLAREPLRLSCLSGEERERRGRMESIRASTVERLAGIYGTPVDVGAVSAILCELERQIIRRDILRGGRRIDGRTRDAIRDLDARVGLLPRTHGSALFTRGDTQALVTVTLGTERDAQSLDELIGERTSRFLLHYNFPPYCVGEVGMIGAPKRREIGHGRLAKRGILAVMPRVEEFPYTVRVVSEITESNGSSSMASVCGASLALMDAGVPIKAAVAGIAMGLICEGADFAILSDIVGEEDHLGDMDFKVAGARDGITALQMDVKLGGLSSEIMRSALTQSRAARVHVLDMMAGVISCPRSGVSAFAPRIRTIKIRQDKIREVIGRGGSVIRSLTEKSGASIEVEDDGTVTIAADSSEKLDRAAHLIEEITAELKVGCTYSGKVIRIVDFGAFVSIGPGREGLVHISQIADRRVRRIGDHLEVGQRVPVKVLEIGRGRVRLSIKDAHS